MRPCDTHIISAKTLETLFKYFEIELGEDFNKMNKKLHNQWIERQGWKPNKIKWKNKKESAAPVEGGESPDEEEE